uniref:Uncharacterized protein n=1 Tax=Fusarium oxysporum (strain Fo5176) TaxID=660025 RepID=A0A0D2YEU7_FUSOF
MVTVVFDSGLVSILSCDCADHGYRYKIGACGLRFLLRSIATCRLTLISANNSLATISMGTSKMLEPARWLMYAAVYLATPAYAFPALMVVFKENKIVSVNRARNYGGVSRLLEGCHAMNKARGKI